jgi:hypothetical protein|nr:MAG TPA: hypothetical protein [Caudoviricetes sp.]
MAIKPKMPELKFSPEVIVDLCPDLPEHCCTMLIDSLERSWDDCQPFEAEIEVPRSTEPYVTCLKVTVDLFNEQVTIERSLS